MGNKSIESMGYLGPTRYKRISTDLVRRRIRTRMYGAVGGGT